MLYERVLRSLSAGSAENAGRVTSPGAGKRSNQ